MNQEQQQQQNQQQQIVTSDNPFSLDTLRQDNCIVYSAKLGKFMLKNKPVISAAWILGMLLLFCAGGFLIPEEKQQIFDQKMDNLNVDQDQLTVARREMDISYQKYYDSKGFFWTCNEICERNYKKYQLKKQHFDNVQNEYNKKENEVREYVGIFSEYGVQESKEVYWNINKQGHQMAKQMSYWDLFFKGIRFSMGDDQSIYEVIIQLVFQILWNFFIVNIINSIRFIWNIIWLVLSYNPNPAEGLAFTGLALLAMTAWFLLYNYILFLIGRGTVNIALDLAESQAIEGQQGRRQRVDPRYIQQQQYQQYQRQQHPHYD